MRFSHKTLFFLAGLSWIVIGTFLLSLGIHFILDALRTPDLSGKFSLLALLSRFVSDRSHAVILLVTLGLLAGFFKGKMALAKTVQRQIKRIDSLPNPAPLKLMYGKGYYFLIAGMIGLGVSLRYWPITTDTRGAIDLTIGSALINGAMLYFRILSRRVYEKST